MTSPTTRTTEATATPGAPAGTSRRIRRQRQRRLALVAVVVTPLILVAAVVVAIAWPDRSDRGAPIPFTTTTSVPFDFARDWSSMVGEAAIQARVGPSQPGRLKAVDGDLTITDRGKVYENLAVEGTISVQAPDVTIRNFTARNVELGDNASNVTLERGRIDGLGDDHNTTDGVVYNDFTARGLDISHQIDGFKAMGNVVIEDCWVHDLNGRRGPEEGAGGYTHNDAVQVSVGAHVVIQRNRFERPGLNSAIFVDPDQGPIDDVRIQNNFLDGGTFTLYVITSRTAPENGMPTNVVVSDNVFGSSALYGKATIGPGVTFTGNIDEEGNAVEARADPESR